MQTHPIVNGIQTKYSGSLQVVRLNFDDPRNATVIAAMGIRAHPTLAIIRGDGTVSRRWFGAPKEGDLDPLVEAVLP